VDDEKLSQQGVQVEDVVSSNPKATAEVQVATA
jgi:hypothetical protein